ncbi:MAG: hypothetical protein KQI81_09020 [Deltaproteobacteria bacterium]|nr:hypothetical protein [Deltaproteobacteria bacterium]
MATTPSYVEKSANLTFGGTRTRTDAITAISDANSALVLFAHTASARYLTACTYNGVSLTPLIKYINSGGPGIDIWYMLNPPAGAHNLYQYYNGNFSGVSRVIQFKDVGAVSSQTGGGTNRSTSLSASITGLKANDLVVSGISHWNGGITDNAGQTRIHYSWNYSIYNADSTKEMTSPGDTTMGYTFSNTDNNALAIFALEAVASIINTPSNVIWW